MCLSKQRSKWPALASFITMCLYFVLQARNTLEREYNKLLILCHEYKTSTQSDLGDGDFKRSKSWRKKFKKEKLSSKEKNRAYKDDTLKRQTESSDSTINDLTSPGRKQRKSPNTGNHPNNSMR